MGRKKVQKQQKPLLDVVVTTAGRFDLLRECLDALENNHGGIPIHTIVFDNGSDAEERLANNDIFEGRKNFTTKRVSENIGFPRAANEGARMGKAPLILFLSDDVLVTENTINAMVKRMDDPKVGIVGAKLLFPEDSTDPRRPAGRIQHFGLSTNIRGDIFHIFVGWSANHPKVQKSREAFAVTGACYMIRRQLIKRANGIFEGY